MRTELQKRANAQELEFLCRGLHTLELDQVIHAKGKDHYHSSHVLHSHHHDKWIDHQLQIDKYRTRIRQLLYARDGTWYKNDYWLIMEAFPYGFPGKPHPIRTGKKRKWINDITPTPGCNKELRQRTV